MIFDILLYLCHHLHLSSRSIAVTGLHKLDGIFSGQDGLQVGIFTAAAGKAQQGIGGPPHSPEQPDREVVVQDLAGPFQQGAQHRPVVLALGIGQAEQHIAAHGIGPGHVAGQIILQGGFQHPCTGKAQFQLLGGRKLGVGAQFAGSYQIAVAFQVKIQVPQRLFQLTLLLKQPGVQPHKETFLIASHALGKVFLNRYFAQQGVLLFYLFSGLGKGGLQVLRGQVQLDQIIHHPGPHGLFDVIKFLKAGQHNKGGQGAALPAGAGKSKAVHHRHFYVCNDDIRLFPLDEFQRQLAVAGSAADSIAQLFPFQHPLQANEHQRLIIHK